MSLLSIIEELRGNQQQPVRETGYSRSGWWKNRENSFYTTRHGESRNWTRRGGSTTTPQRTFRFEVHDILKHDNYIRSSAAKVARFNMEFQEINAHTILVRITTNVWRIEPGPQRYVRLTESQVNAAMTGEPWKQESITLAMTMTPYYTSRRRVEIDTENNRAWFGPPGAHSTKFTSIPSDKKNRYQFNYAIASAGGLPPFEVRIRELRGLDSQLWGSEVTDEQIERVFNPIQLAQYELPTIKRKKYDMLYPDLETRDYGSLTFQRIGDPEKMSASETLADIAESRGHRILVTINQKSDLLYPEGGDIVSELINPGIYVVSEPLGSGKMSIFDRRTSILNTLSRYRLEVELGRHDFLTVIDIDSDNITEEGFDSHRVGSKVEIETDITSEDDSLMDRLF